MTTSNKRVLISGLGLAGNVAGILLAVKRKSGFWGGVGWFLVGGVAGVAAGYVISSVVPDTEEPKKTQASLDINVEL